MTEPRPIRVLFVGDDASSTEIAASLLRRLAGELVEVITAGTQLPDPGGRTDEMLVGMGLNPTSEAPLSARVLQHADRVIVLGTGLDVARLAGHRYTEWDLSTRDLPTHVEKLVEDLFAPAVAEDESTGVRRVRRRLTRLRRRRPRR